MSYSYNYVNPNNPNDKKPHAVTQVGTAFYCYDLNGNLTRRNATSSACANGDVLAYDAENRLTSITVGANTTTYLYDGDGNRVKRVANGVTSYYIGNHYEVTNGSVLKFYYFGKQRVAIRTSAGVTYIHGDHLGSTSATSGVSVSAQTYYAFGNIRGTTGTVPTDFGFTGQRRDASAGLMYYGARYYDSALGRFVSADTLVPSAGNPQALNRYAYAYNNPLRYTDPTGHDAPDIINFLGEFSTGAAYEAWYNIAWFIPGHENLQVQAGESEAMTAGRVFGDVIAIGIGIDETIIGGGMIGSGALACGTAVLCFAGAPDMAAGVVVGGSGIATAGSAIANGAQNLNNLISMAKGSNWKVGDPINMPDANGNYPDWTTVRERYWKNRAQTASRGEFAPQNLGRMKQGLAPMARIIARIRATGQEVEMTVSMELHHIEGRGGFDPHNTDNLVEVWPWEHSGLDPNRYLDWDFVRFK